MIADELSVRLGDVLVATIVRFDDDRILLAFDRAYIDDSDRPTLGLAFNDEHGGIVTDQRPTRRRAPPYFANLLPEGHLRRYIAARAEVNETRDFPLLRLLGGDLPGAVVLVGEREPAGDPTGTEDQLTADAPLRFSLAGVQLKFSALPLNRHQRAQRPSVAVQWEVGVALGRRRSRCRAKARYRIRLWGARRGRWWPHRARARSRWRLDRQAAVRGVPRRAGERVRHHEPRSRGRHRHP